MLGKLFTEKRSSESRAAMRAHAHNRRRRHETLSLVATKMPHNFGREGGTANEMASTSGRVMDPLPLTLGLCDASPPTSSKSLHGHGGGGVLGQLFTTKRSRGSSAPIRLNAHNRRHRHETVSLVAVPTPITCACTQPSQMGERASGPGSSRSDTYVHGLITLTPAAVLQGCRRSWRLSKNGAVLHGQTLPTPGVIIRTLH